MQATAKRDYNLVAFTKEEILALLSFAGESEHHSAVHIRIDGSGKLVVAASNGKRSVKAESKAGGAKPCELAIDAPYLEKCRASIDKGQSLVLEITPTAVKDGLIVDAVSGDTVAKVTWNRDLANTQLSMTEIISGTKPPNDKNHTGSWCAIDPEVFRALNRIRVATDGMPVTIYPPSEPTAPIHFEARGEAAHWTGAIMPETVLGPGEAADEPEEEPPPGEPARRQQSLFGGGRVADSADPPDTSEDEGIVDDDYEPDAEPEPDLPTAKKKRAKKAPAAKKGPAKK